MNARDRLIVALDVPSWSEAKKIIETLGDTVGFYKVGLQLFTAEGPRAVQELAGMHKKVFLDLKLHDIPTTVASAVRSATKLGVAMLTIHAGGGTKMMEAAVQAAQETPGQPKVIAVTVLTSLSSAELPLLGIGGRLEDQVARLADLAIHSKCDGVVASPLELAALRRQLGPKPIIVTPGIRPSGAEANDQSRTATPYEAVQGGASYFVVGRPITSAEDPLGAARAILSEIDSAAKR